MNKIDLIALDLDGTLLDPLGRVTQASKDAIAQARASVATGRAAPEAAYFAQEAGCGVLAAALGGAVMCDARTGAHLRRWDLPRETGRRALELCLNREIVLMIFAGEAIVLDPYSKKLLMKHYPFPCFHDNAVAALEGVSLTASSDRDFELVPAKVGKGRTLALMSLLRGVPLERCAAVGDSLNDLSMLEVVGTPIAMGNANSQVKAAARYVAADNGHDGVAEAIRWCLAQNA